MDAGVQDDGLVLHVRGLRRTFAAGGAPVRALRGVDLEVARGEFVALMGPSGCGKSTLLHVVAGLEAADEGTVVLAGRDVTRLDEDSLARMRRHDVGLVFQSAPLLDGMTVLDNVALAALVGGASRRAARDRAVRLLDLLGLLERATSAVAGLSGGQRQRLAVARALANAPTLLLADEPTGSLDSAGAAELLDLFRRLHDQGQTILLVTHDPAVAAAAQRVVHLRDGRLDRDAAVGAAVVPHPLPVPAP